MQTLLFVCIHNSARSQMAEAFVNLNAHDTFRAYSAGLEAGRLNPIVVIAMAELGIDISANATKTVDDPAIREREYDYVITVCDESSAQACPVFRGPGKRLHWSFEDPSSLTGTEEEKLTQTRIIRDQIKSRVNDFLATQPK